MSIPLLSRCCLWLILSLFAIATYADSPLQDLTLRFEQGQVVLSDQNKTILFEFPIEEIHGVMINQRNVRRLLVDFQNDTLPLPISYHGGRNGETAIIIKQAPLSSMKHRLTGDNTGELFWDKEAKQADLRYQGATTIKLEDSYPLELIIEGKDSADFIIGISSSLSQKSVQHVQSGATTVFSSWDEPNRSVFVKLDKIPDTQSALE